MFVLASSASGGARAGLAATLGVAAGCLAHATMAALGISALIAASPPAFEALRIAGALYLLWIGVGALRTAFGDLRDNRTPPAGETASLNAFRRGALTNVLNPKVGIFYVAFLPQFTNPLLGSVPLQIVILAAIHILIGILWLGALSIASGRAAETLGRNRRVRAWLDGTAGFVYIALALRMLVLERRPG
ncbi:MAG: LysE family translocator [Alphaproteobacteria bacterium]|nr:LysE family translocator [Alphaproteobacteria bacterium]